MEWTRWWAAIMMLLRRGEQKLQVSFGGGHFLGGLASWGECSWKFEMTLLLEAFAIETGNCRCTGDNSIVGKAIDVEQNKASLLYVCLYRNSNDDLIALCFGLFFEIFFTRDQGGRGGFLVTWNIQSSIS